ncbi:MAG: hypothetical protein RJA98_3583 [Pseudomonadota bacterium]|jgi:hypothetical protein
MFVAVGVAFAWGALGYNFGSSARPGPGYFPFGLGALLAVLGSVVLYKSLTVPNDDGDPIGAIAWKPLLLILVAVAIFGWALPHLGMFIALPLLVIVSSIASDEFDLKASIFNSVILTVMSWAMFVLGLKLTIPLWPTLFGMGS